MLEAKDIRYHIGKKTILDGVAATFEPGLLHVILGPNGSGKSTLLKIISGELRPSSGIVLYDGKDAFSFEKTALARRRAVMTQAPELHFPLAVKEVVMMGRYPHFQFQPSKHDLHISHELMQSLDVLALSERDYLTLSGGEKQRVQFARAQAQIWEAPVNANRYLLLDEPISNADIHYQHQFMQRLQQLKQSGICVIAVLHDLNLSLQYADRLLFMDQGKVIRQGGKDIVSAALISEVFKVPVEIWQHAPGAPPMIIYKNS